ncbi:DUF5634 family protein [Priestia megaterium]|uniref:DUF5634 family protein n=1 Tax=Priestia megaterium TaxID=1404 RepID=UPI002E23044B|nr:DUF5634 family protein [Priestia megaterium]
MAKGIFFRESVIQRDLERFAPAIAKSINGRCVTLMHTHTEEIRMGYSATTDYGVFDITMPYEQDDRCQYAILDEVWTVRNHRKGESKTGFPTLREVFEYIESFK